jgi:hypothetical protein
MHYTDSKRLDAKMRAIEDALSRIGEPITEAQAKSVAVLEDCECKAGMFALATSRRQLLSGTGLIAAVGMTAMLPRTADAKAPPGAVEYPVQGDSTKEQGRILAATAHARSSRPKSARHFPKRRPDIRRCRTATAPLRRPACTMSVTTAGSRTSTPLDIA